jgi:hypothetical protein
VGAALQVYRYRHDSDAVGRQQLKWVSFAFAAAAVGDLVGYLLPPALWPSLINAPPQPQTTPAGILYVLFFGPLLAIIAVCLVPVSILISILRYRLWDVDIIIRRTLIYSALTLSLALVYFSSVLLLQAIFRALTGQGQSELVTVVSTLLIAALFVPLRTWVQRGIDRRFYRRKYDAAKTLAAFGALARDEVDLDTLRNDLVLVVQETMQPAHVSLWLRRPDG